MRQFAGFGTPEETNQRYKQLLAAGGTGLSVAFDLPTLMGRDPDDPLSLGEVGKCGVSIVSLADMERLFEGISLADITTSMTINSPAPMIFAMYLVVAEQQGADWQTLSGTIQNDILKEFIAQKEYIFPPRPSMRLITDIFKFCGKEVPRWNTISVSGYHIREAGATALQELAFTLRDGIEYVQYGVDAGLDVDEFVPRLSFFFNAHSDFFEEIAKYRAARKIWATVMRERFGARDERSLKLRFHTQTAGVSLTAQQPYNNVVRTALQALVGGARRHQLAPYELAGRGARPAHGGGRDACAADAAGHRARERRDEHGRSARRLLLRRTADPRHGRGRLQILRDDRSAGRHGRGDRAGVSRSAKSPSRRTGSSRRSRKKRSHCRRQRLRRGERAAAPDSLHRRLRGRLADGPARRGEGPSGPGAGGGRSLEALSQAARGPRTRCTR